jgi:predicted ester cyclase
VCAVITGIGGRTVEERGTFGGNFFLSQDRLRGGPDPSFCAPDYSARIAGYPAMTYQQHHGFAVGFYAAFPDLTHTIEEVVVERDRVVVRFTLRGTHTGNYMGVPASGQPVEVGAMARLDIDAGKVRSLVAQFDELGMMRRIGGVRA